MLLSPYAKRALSRELERFENSKLSITQRLREIEDDRERQMANLNEIDQAIAQLKADLKAV